ncbi:MAG TPA: hypothetical protein GX700_07900, partial [Paracoccus sp.]|nr:hypothetical protein [Paracoccus sp. (in: a-proteobacteria)]
MAISEIDFGAARPIEGYGPEFYRIGGAALPAPALNVPGREAGWGGFGDMAPL